MAKKCIIFTRVSSSTQNLDSQEKEVLAAAMRDGYKKDNCICIPEHGISGALPIEQRLGLIRMEQLIQSDKSINCCYIYMVDRLARDIDVSVMMKRFFQNNKIQLKVTHQGLALLNDDGTINNAASSMFVLFAEFAEQERRNIIARTFRGREYLKESGKAYFAKIAFGYNADSSRNFIINEDEANIVKMIYSLFLSDKFSTFSLAEYLNKRGYTLRGKPFNHSSIDNILRRNTYCGLSDKNYPSFISQETYLNAVTLLKEHGNKTKCNTRYNYFGKGIVFSDEGQKMSIKGSLKNAIYHSDNFDISFNAIESIILFYTKELASSNSSIELETKKNELINQINDVQKQIDTIQKNIQKKSVDIDNIVEDIYIKHRFSADKAEKVMSMLEGEIKQLKIDEDILRGKQETYAKMYKQIDEQKAMTEDDINELPYDELCELCHNTIKQVLVHKIGGYKYQVHVQPMIENGNEFIVNVHSHNHQLVQQEYMETVYYDFSDEWKDWTKSKTKVK